jgi:hypothetical protein
VLAFECEDGLDEPYFSIMLTTPRMIDGTELTKPVEIDDTYKLIYEGIIIPTDNMCWRAVTYTFSSYIVGYSVTVMGETDQDRVFHIRAMGVSTNSTERVGTFYFRSWSARVSLFRPKAYLGDAAAAYANAAMAVFASILVRLMCFAHVYNVLSHVLDIYHILCYSVQIITMYFHMYQTSILALF